jgi:hypothetical protein
VARYVRDSLLLQLDRPSGAGIAVAPLARALAGRQVLLPLLAAFAILAAILLAAGDRLTGLLRLSRLLVRLRGLLGRLRLRRPMLVVLHR